MVVCKEQERARTAAESLVGQLYTSVPPLSWIPCLLDDQLCGASISDLFCHSNRCCLRSQLLTHDMLAETLECQIAES